jgi:hypothetical protein
VAADFTPVPASSGQLPGQCPSSFDDAPPQLTSRALALVCGSERAPGVHRPVLEAALQQPIASDTMRERLSRRLARCQRQFR